ncbi:MAG: hypothetical protein A2W00_11885 [Candidatus Eisenbacteria bacterium RBG_16_71_46]|nr:MAG: hypothetical protein A2W00_11885 [Candidatus Eisenbacteria bacterium RBG_16_71_46]OGF22710.1 MAG: hypothetical protein A2V63_06955 [Candidatus Eisenbacteria bacterium RBG_19FT_COMBO_70_11]
MRSFRVLLLASALLLGATAAHAFVSQTVTFTGHPSDFNPANLLGDDGTDTQTFCSPAALPMNLGRVYITNDNNFLYVGVEFDSTCFCDMNLGFAFDVGTAGGGTTDPFGRSIGWTNVPFKPDFVVYDVTPVSCNTFNYEILYKWNAGTTAWDNASTQVNPSWGSGANGLGIVDSTHFRELKLPLSVLGVGVGTTMRVEFWVTQEGTTKGPLDAFCSDAVQMSRVGQTTFDTTAVVQMTCMNDYTILSFQDVTPPTVTGACAVDFPLLGDRTFSLSSNKVDITFSEPVDQTSAETIGNYAFSGPVTRSVTGATRDVSAHNVVHLTLNSAITSNASFFNITVTNVKDLATPSNTIVANGTTNVGSFFIQRVTFNGDFHIGLCNGSFAVTDSFAIEGSLIPLTIATLCDNALMYDTNADSIYTVTVPFCMPKNAGTGKGEADLAWKFSNKCTTYEPLGSNRAYHLTSDNGASVVLNEAWNNDNPANFTTHPIDVIFTVDATLFNPTGSDVITLLGSQAPLSFTQPGIPMLDNGVSPDAVPGDKIYTAVVRFPICTPKNVDWKVDFNGVIECLGQGNRNVFLNDALYDIVGGTLGPLTLPARGIDRCTTTDKAIAVIFRVDAKLLHPSAFPTDTVGLMADRAPLSFATPPGAGGIMKDDGVAPDAQAGDLVYTLAVTFPDSTEFNVGFKYWSDAWPTNGGFECEGEGNRGFTLDDVNYSTGNPLVRVLSQWNYCTEPVGVEDIGPRDLAIPGFGLLFQNAPNPAGASARIRFVLKQSGFVTLSVYDVSGRRVAKLLEGELAAGQHEALWNGRDLAGQRVRSGIYFYELRRDNESLMRRMVVTQ